LKNNKTQKGRGNGSSGRALGNPGFSTTTKEGKEGREGGIKRGRKGGKWVKTGQGR
jgi:hypothetical protein